MRESTENRKPLEMQAKKPIPIKSLNPRFQEKYSLDKIYDVNEDRAEANKLKKVHKRETKGAVRELRKDNAFITTEKSKKHKLEIEERQEKGKKIMAMFEAERSEQKSLEKEKLKASRKKSAF